MQVLMTANEESLGTGLQARASGEPCDELPNTHFHET